jgi:hypothetical protein
MVLVLSRVYRWSPVRSVAPLQWTATAAAQWDGDARQNGVHGTHGTGW